MTTWLSSWRRLLSTTGVCFALCFGLLAWRVSAGEDPVPSAATQTTITQTSTTDDTSSSAAQESTTPTTQAS